MRECKTDTGAAAKKQNTFQQSVMRNYLLFLIGLFTVFHSLSFSAAQTGAVHIADFSSLSPNSLPEDWIQILPKKQKAYTDYSVIRESNDTFLRARSNGTGSYIEKDLGQIDVAQFPIMEWTWMVSRFPEVEWEEDKSDNDFAIRIELVYDFKGSAFNILNIIRKGLIRTVFLHYPPEVIISYVWALKVPAEVHFVSPDNKRMMTMPIESGKSMKGRWIQEQRNIKKDFDKFIANKHIVLKKIRIRADTDNSLTGAESGIKKISLFQRQ